jgi:hypothetical protein
MALGAANISIKLASNGSVRSQRYIDKKLLDSLILFSDMTDFDIF